MSPPPATLPAQIWFGQHPPDPTRFREITNHPGPRKPKGGLWTVDRAKGLGAWAEWCRRDNFPRARSGYLLTVNPTAQILRLDDRVSAQAAWEQYHRPDFTMEPDYSEPRLDYEAMAKDWDGVFVGRSIIRLGPFDSVGAMLHGWDVPSTLWFNWQFQTITPLLELPKPLKSCNQTTFPCLCPKGLYLKVLRPQ